MTVLAKAIRAATLGTALVVCAAGAEDLARNFAAPPASARPWVYWFWLNGNISREGITADLEAMARVGVGGVLIMEVDQNTPKGTVAYGSAQWRELFHFMLAEARRLGLEVNVNNDAGWCGSGGPWITPELSMQNLTVSETTVSGPQSFAGTLPQPASLLGYYRDVAVLAFPAPEGDQVLSRDSAPLLSSSAPTQESKLPKLLTGGARVELPWPAPGQAAPWIQAAFSQPFTARTITIGVSGNFRFGLHGHLEVSDDGIAFRSIGEFDGQPPAIVFNVPATSARWFRIVFTQYRHPRQGNVSVSELQLSPRFRLDGLAVKTAVIPSQFSATSSVPSLATWPQIPAALCIPRDRVMDVTDKLHPDGRLEWQVPPGKWTILRIGHTSNGRMNHPAPDGGLGLECDKLSKAAAQATFAGLVGRLVHDNAQPGGGSAPLVALHVDSWEVGSQNWTPQMRSDFERLRGYDPGPFLPVVTGRVVDSPEVSERFLWDLRQTIAELLRENYAGELERLAKRDGLRLSIEAYFGPPTDEIAYGGRADEPMAEFWSSNRFDQGYSCLEMASAAHLYGHRIVAAESFTANDKERWQGYPGNIKDLGDWAFCQGINRFVVHRYALQPWLNSRPGVSMGPWGLHYERTQTWWEQSRSWHTYLARCQYLLQQGLPVVDICCLEPEGASRFNPPAAVRVAGSIERPGYSFDGCPPEVLMNRIQVRDGRLVLPDGMSYRVLLLPEVETMTPQLLRRVRELADAGATVIGSAPPRKSPSLSGYPACDAEVGRLARLLWKSGKVIAGQSPAQFLADRGVPPDFASRNAAGEENLRYTHRVIEGSEVYFVANKNGRSEDAVCSFRVQGRRPEFWSPDSGRIEPAAVFSESGGCVRMPLHFDAFGSVFVVFPPVERRSSESIASQALLQQGGGLPEPVGAANSMWIGRRSSDRTIEIGSFTGGSWELTTSDGRKVSALVSSPPPPQALSGPWTVAFDPHWGGPPEPVPFPALTDWAQRPELGVRYYSGSAVYRQNFSRHSAGEGHSRTFLNLGQVAVMAEVKLNGQNLGVLWKAPYRIEVTAALHAGENDLEVTVTNLWINRQIGDEQLPEDSERDAKGFLLRWPQWLLSGKASPSGRFSFGTSRLWAKTDPLAKSGLLGPVVLETLATTTVRP